MGLWRSLFYSCICLKISILIKKINFKLKKNIKQNITSKNFPLSLQPIHGRSQLACLLPSFLNTNAQNPNEIKVIFKWIMKMKYLVVKRIFKTEGPTSHPQPWSHSFIRFLSRAPSFNPGWRVPLLSSKIHIPIKDTKTYLTI